MRALFVLGLAIVILGVGAFTLLLNHQAVPFVAEVQEFGRGADRHGNYSLPYANLSLGFSSPSSLDPNLLIITMFCPRGAIQLVNGTWVTSVALRYFDNGFPHWVAEPTPGSTSTAYTATVTNPNGRVVGGLIPSETSPVGIIESGADIKLTLPSWAASPEGFTATLTYVGYPGTAVIVLH